MLERDRPFPDWESLYRSQNVESMPWYNESLDSDLESELNGDKIVKGSFLDLGTGLGTQAFQLCQRGFEVTGTDLSPTSIQKAFVRFNGATGNKIKFVVDDILDSKLSNNEFDYIFDRGCFHVLSPTSRSKYVNAVHRILKKGGILFLKCFSHEEPDRDTGPYRFSPFQISKIFTSGGFKIKNFKETLYQGTLNPLPRALFTVLLK